ncbi:MAG: hypothetical protein JJT78_00885 [Leptospira sp.]|nr:hypothetical protein [Leptospira sp.]
MKQRIIYTILILSLTSCAVLENIQSRIPKPEFSLAGMKIKEVNLSELTLTLNSVVKNPYNVTLPTSKLGLDMAIEGMKLSHIDTDLGAIDAKSTKTLPFDIKLKYTDLLKFYKSYPSKESLDMNFKGDLKLPIPQNYQIAGQNEISFPIDYTSPIPSLQPSVELSNFSVAMPDLTKLATQTATNYLGGLFGGSTEAESPSIDTSFDLKFSNNSPAKFLLSDLKFDLELEGNSFLKGAPKEIIQEDTSNIVKVKTEIPIVDAGSSLISTLKNKTARYNLKGLSGISFPGIRSEKSDFNYATNGTLKWK